jgi:hypothetical protein
MGMILVRQASLATSLVFASAIVVALSGCCTSINSELGPSSPNGPQVVIDTLAPTTMAKARDRAPAKSEPGVPAPSVISVSRENWKETPFAVPVSGVQHHPIYTDDKPHFARDTARSRGEYPTQLTALEVSTQKGNGDMAWEALAAPVRAGWDIVRMPVWAFRKAPWSVQQSPIDKQPYARGPVLTRKEPITGSPIPTQPPEPLDPAVKALGKTPDEVKKDEAEAAAEAKRQAEKEKKEPKKDNK